MGFQNEDALVQSGFGEKVGRGMLIREKHIIAKHMFG
jgi:hypothetical protein